MFTRRKQCDTRDLHGNHWCSEVFYEEVASSSFFEYHFVIEWPLNYNRIFRNLLAKLFQVAELFTIYEVEKSIQKGLHMHPPSPIQVEPLYYCTFYLWVMCESRETPKVIGTCLILSLATLLLTCMPESLTMSA